jgi:hypothetical protein
VEEALKHGFRFLLKKANGLEFLDKTAPTAVSDASVVTSKGMVKSDRLSKGRVDMADLRLMKATLAASDQVKELALSKSVRGLAIVA